MASVVTPGSIHTVDLIRYLGGDVTEVYAKADRYFDRHLDSFTALIRFENVGYSPMKGKSVLKNVTMEVPAGSRISTEYVNLTRRYFERLLKLAPADPELPTAQLGPADRHRRVGAARQETEHGDRHHTDGQHSQIPHIGTFPLTREARERVLSLISREARVQNHFRRRTPRREN